MFLFNFSWNHKGLFSSGRKSPSKEKEKAEKAEKASAARANKEKSPVKENLANSAADNNNKNKDKGTPAGFTKPYEYQETDPNVSPSKKNFKSTGFRYDEDPNNQTRNKDSDGQLSPNSESRRATGLAFNYAPGADNKVKETADKLKQGELSPRTRDKIQKGELSPKSREKLLKEGNLSPKTKAKLASLAGDVDAERLKYSPTKSYSPASGNSEKAASNVPTGTQGVYRPITDDPTNKFLENERYNKDLAFVPSELKTNAVVEEPRKKIKVKIMVVVGKLDPKTKKIDLAGGDVEHSIGILDKDTGKVESKYGLIDPKTGTVEALNASGQKVVYKGLVEAKTGQIELNEGVIDPKTGAINGELGQVIHIVPEINPLVEITAITSKVDASKKVDTVNGEIEKSRGTLDLETG